MLVVLFAVTKPLMKNSLTFPTTPIRYMERAWGVVLGKIEMADSQIMYFSVVSARGLLAEEGVPLKYWERKVEFGFSR
jgi:hypothetical protein